MPRIRAWAPVLGLLIRTTTAYAFSCPTPPAGIQDIKAFRYYTDAAGSIRDEQKFKETHELTKPFEDFARDVARMSDTYLESGDAQAATCTGKWLDRWAQDRAMLGKMIIVDNDQPEYTRKWTHASVAIAYLKVKPALGQDTRTRIEAWLQEISHATLAYWKNPKKTRNNHYYWTGVGVMATAVASGDKVLLADARGIYESGLRDIAADGSLPNEMRRAGRALHYHNFSAAPLVLIAEMARYVGQDWYALQDNRINLLAERVADGFADPRWFAEQSGTPAQIIPPADDGAWAAFYVKRAPHPEKFQAMLKKYPLVMRDLGGNLSLMAEKSVFDAPVP
jgi:poly(beta-D-mannuronate) lyase